MRTVIADFRKRSDEIEQYFSFIQEIEEKDGKLAIDLKH